MICFRCKHCGRDAPPEWGVDRHCPESGAPKGRRFCEYEAVEFTATEVAAMFSHRHVDLAALGTGVVKLRPFLAEDPGGGAPGA